MPRQVKNILYDTNHFKLKKECFLMEILHALQVPKVGTKKIVFVSTMFDRSLITGIHCSFRHGETNVQFFCLFRHNKSMFLIAL